MAAAAATADMAAETRRAVIRSEKFMEWQRELSSTRASYGGRRRCDDTEAAASNGLKKHPRKSDEEDAKGSKGLGERDLEAQHPVTVSQAEINAINAKVKEQRQRPDSKRLEKELESGSKKIVPKKGKGASDPADVENSRLRKCKQSGTQAVHIKRLQHNEVSQQIQQQTCSTQPVNRRRRQMPSVDQEPLSSKRTACGEAVALVDLPNRGSKRSRRAAKRLANEEPQRPPLKLPKLNLVLSRKEIHEDWFKITGQKYSGKPRKSMLFQLGLGLCASLTCPSTIRYLNDPQ